MTTHPDIRTELPPSIRGRFDSLGAYVNAVISGIEDARRTPRSRRLSLSVKQDIVLLVFIASLRQFLIEGSTAATAAANQVVSLEFAGFTVGTQFFAPDNENTRRGAVLAVALWSQIEEEFVDLRTVNLKAYRGTLCRRQEAGKIGSIPRHCAAT